MRLFTSNSKMSRSRAIWCATLALLLVIPLVLVIWGFLLPCQYEDKGTYFFDVREVKEAAIRIPASPALKSLTFGGLLDMLCQKIIQLPLSSPVHKAVYDEGFWTGVPMP